MSSTIAPKPRKKGKKKTTGRATPPAKKAGRGKASPADKAKTPKLRQVRVKRGGDMLPEIKDGLVSVGQEVFYWFGLLPSLTTAAMTVGGMSFQHVSYRIKYHKHTDAQTRVPLIGQVAGLSYEKLVAVKAEMRRLMFRFDDKGEGAEAMDYEGEDLEILDELPLRKAQPIMIPTEASIATRRANKYAANPYRPQAGDEPGIAHLFMVPCENQKRPKPGSEYPHPLSITGLYWPGEEPDGVEPEEE